MKQLFFILFGVLLLPYSSMASSCDEIDMAFKSLIESTDNKKPVCRCYAESLDSSRRAKHLGEDANGLWIGCTGSNMPAVFRSLDALNETLVSQLVIWNSLINLVPSDMFSKVRPRTLSLENCMVSLLRPNAFGNIGRRMKTLLLRNNAFQRVEPSIAKELPGLEKLDLSGNKISTIGNNSFVGLGLLEELLLDNNQLTEIQDGDFHGLNSLKVLSLANNKLSKITKNIFAGLDNLETLVLKDNNLHDVDWNAFAGLKKLKILDLGGNRLTMVELRRLQNLQRLYINNNSIQDLKNVILRDLNSLVSLSLDRNEVHQILNDDLSNLSQSGRLSSLSLVSNKISLIESRALEHVHELSFLSLQYNEIARLSDTQTGISFLRPLKKLKSLYLSHNKLEEINSDSFQGLTQLSELALDHNSIHMIEKRSFAGIQLSKLFMNGNQLHYIPKGIFDDWDKKLIYAIDLSDNQWECVCSSPNEWLAEWLYSIAEANTPQGDLGCLRELCVKSTDEQHPPWITALAIAISTLTIILIIVIGLLLIQEGKHSRLTSLVNNIQRTPSDRERLIVSESQSFPNTSTTTSNEVAMPTRSSIKIPDSSGNGTRKKVHFGDAE